MKYHFYASIKTGELIIIYTLKIALWSYIYLTSNMSNMSNLVTSFTFSCILGPITASDFISGHRFQRDFYSAWNFLSNGIWYENIWILQILTLRQFLRFWSQITPTPPGPVKKFLIPNFEHTQVYSLLNTSY